MPDKEPDRGPEKWDMRMNFWGNRRLSSLLDEARRVSGMGKGQIIRMGSEKMARQIIKSSKLDVRKEFEE